MGNLKELKFNDLRSTAKELGIHIKNGTKSQYLQAVSKVLNENENQPKKAKSKSAPKSAATQLKLVLLSQIDEDAIFKYPTGKKECKIADKTEDGKFTITAVDSTRKWNETADQKVVLV